jgi:glyoxylase-like metal-dependent hydrolase (beta-lactamase superfamily II)
MHIHHVSCGTMCPLGGRLVDGFSHGLSAKLVCHCWVVETSDGLILVDTGFGLEDVHYPRPRLSSVMLKLNRIQLSEENTAIRQIQKLGFRPSDVRHIILTHLDFDHAGGIADFPHAQVHVMRSELEHALKPKSWLDRQRFRTAQWVREHNWNTYETKGERWFGFECVGRLNGLPPEILFIPLAGHTWGHAGVAVKTQHGWMLHAGDAYFYRRELEAERYRCTPGLRLYQRFMEVNRDLRLANLARLRQLVRNHSNEVRVCSAHDAIELVAYQAAQLPLRQQQHQLSQRHELSPQPV